MREVMKIVRSLEDFDLLVKKGLKTIENETKEQRDGFLSIPLGTWGASILWNFLTGKGVAATRQDLCDAVRAGRVGVISVGVRIHRARQDFKCHLFHWLILKYKSVIRMNLTSEVFIYEITCQTLQTMVPTQ